MGLKQRHIIVLISVVAMFLASCSGTKWVIQPDPVVDYRSGDVIESYSFVRQTNIPTPNRPIVEFELRDINVIEYPQRTQSQRYVQQYKLRPGLVALSLASSAAVLYVANSPNVNSEGGFKNQKLILNSAAVVLAASGFVALKPNGAPIPTEERRLLAQTGTIVLRDTVSYVSDVPTASYVTVKYRGETLIENVRKEFTRGRMLFDINREVQFVPVQSVEPGNLEIIIEALGKVSQIEVPVTSVMAQYVRVTAESTPLRSGPRDVPGNILADIVKESQLQYQETYDSDWFRVLYGVASTYIRRSDIELIWRPLGRTDESLVITEREANFGRVDVETNIPVKTTKIDEAYTVVIGNTDYLTGLPRRRTAALNMDIVQRYAIQTLGVRDDRLMSISNPERFDFEELLGFGGRQTGLRSTLNDQTKLFIYISGLGYMSGDDEGVIYLLPSDSRPDDPAATAVRLEEVFRAIGRLPFQQCVVVVDIDFISGAAAMQRASGMSGYEQYRQLTSEFINRPNTAVIFTNQIQQKSGDYVSRDGRVNNRYSIGTYFFARALKENRTRIGDIYQFMDNNVNFTSRLLHDRAQSPVFLGDPDLRLTGN
jgi:hypothetical protein